MNKEFNIKNALQFRINELNIRRKHDKTQIKQLKKILKERKKNARKNKQRN